MNFCIQGRQIIWSCFHHMGKEKCWTFGRRWREEQLIWKVVKRIGNYSKKFWKGCHLTWMLITKILIKSGVDRVNVRRYRYPHLLKIEIKGQVRWGKCWNRTFRRQLRCQIMSCVFIEELLGETLCLSLNLP